MRFNHRRRGNRLDAVAARMTTSLTHLQMPRRGGPRGVTMIEYVLLAAIVVVLAVLLRSRLYAMFGTILDSIQTALGTSAP